MARLQLTALSGDTFGIDTSDPALMASWLLETLPKVISDHPALNEARFYVYGHSEQQPDGSVKSDWPHSRPEERFMTATNLLEVAHLLDGIAKRREAKLAAPALDKLRERAEQ